MFEIDTYWERFYSSHSVGEMVIWMSMREAPVGSAIMAMWPMEMGMFMWIWPPNSLTLAMDWLISATVK